jgi:hypothetical protein
MTLPSLQRFSKAIVGQMMAGADVNIFATHTSPAYPIGQGCQGASGEVYRYCSFDGPVVQGTIVGPNLTNVAKAVTSTAPVASPITVQAEYPILPNGVGSHYVEVTLSSIAVNQFQGGKLIVAARTGAGYTYDIKGNTVTGNTQSGAVRFQLVQPLQALLSPSSSIIVAPSMFNDLVQVNVSANWQVAGVTMSNIGNNSGVTNLFGWIQTKGAVGCLEDNTSVSLTGGQAVVPSKQYPGYYTGYGQAGTVGYSIPAIGQVLQVNGTTGAYGTIYLILE